MLVRFAVTNFLSFKDRTEFNMLTGTIKTHKHHVYKSNGIKLLKSAAIYGANGAGKSNLMIAISTLRDMVAGDDDVKSSWGHSFRLSEGNSDKPSVLEIEFIKESKTFYYSLSLGYDYIISEALSETHTSAEDTPIFIRNTSEKGEHQITFFNEQTTRDEIFNDVLKDFLLANQTLLNLVIDSPRIEKTLKKQNKDIISVCDWFEKDIFVIHPSTTQTGMIGRISTDPSYKNFVDKILIALDLGIHSFGIESFALDDYYGEGKRERREEIITQLEKNAYVVLDDIDKKEEYAAVKEDGNFYVKKLVFQHKDENGSLVNFNSYEESDGTIRLIDFIPLFRVLQYNKVMFIDELDRSIHPYLMKKLVDKILNGDENIKGQLIFTTHDSNLLDLKIQRQDEIWFAEKDLVGATHIYPLSEFKPRYDLDIRKGYLNGRFGAIPFLSGFNSLKL